MDRKIYKLPFYDDNIPDWKCPTCLKGVLKIKKGSFFKEELANSKSAHQCEEWEPEWIEYTYVCLLQCSNDKCKEIIANTGTGSVNWDEAYDVDGSPFQQYYDYFKPKYFNPPLKLFSIPSNTPADVVHSINESFKLFFCSPGAASNHIRIAIELILTKLKVKRFNNNGSKRSLITLHQRIDLLPSQYIELKDLFYAIKWLGNAGSHSEQNLTQDDVMDAYEILEHILSEIHEKKATKIKALAKSVNKRKGPKKTKSRFLL